MTTEQEPESVDDALADQAAELIQETNAQYEERKREQEEFLETVAEEEGAEVLETQCNIVGDYTVPLKAKLNGDVLDRLGALQARVERIEEQPEDTGAYEYGEAAEDVSQLLADIVNDPEWHKDLFYQVYRDEGLEPLGSLLETCFESLEAEQERRQGTASGFREEPGGT